MKKIDSPAIVDDLKKTIYFKSIIFKCFLLRFVEKKNLNTNLIPEIVFKISYILILIVLFYSQRF